MSPTSRSLALLRSQGWLAEVVEHWNPFSKTRKDLFGVWDIVAIRPGQVAFIQTTTAGNMKARMKKIAAHPDSDYMRESGAMLAVHGWHKVGRKWECKIEDVT